jgi:Na+-translocating ferredoxin:NAD+ oxidoreductase subunit D
MSIQIGAPHIHGGESVKMIMWSVVIALMPALFASFYFFGISALLVTLTAVISCIIFEFLISKLLYKNKEITITDGSAVITGILLAFNLPGSIPLWMVVIGSLAAIGIAKMPYGGLGKNIFNPALVGRVILLVSFPVEMTTWPLPIVNNSLITDAVSGPTLLGSLREGMLNGMTLPQILEKSPSYVDMFLGNIGGSLGEVSALAILIGGIFLLFRKIISWHIPVSFILTVFVFTGIIWESDPQRYFDPLYQVLAGGVMLGAVFMATDMVTSPMTKKGQLIFGFGCGLITVLIRIWGSYPEGVSFAILIMNAFVPLINKGFRPKHFGAGEKW